MSRRVPSYFAFALVMITACANENNSGAPRTVSDAEIPCAAEGQCVAVPAAPSNQADATPKKQSESTAPLNSSTSSREIPCAEPGECPAI